MVASPLLRDDEDERVKFRGARGPVRAGCALWGVGMVRTFVSKPIQKRKTEKESLLKDSALIKGLIKEALRSCCPQSVLAKPGHSQARHRDGLPPLHGPAENMRWTHVGRLDLS